MSKAEYIFTIFLVDLNKTHNVPIKSSCFREKCFFSHEPMTIFPTHSLQNAFHYIYLIDETMHIGYQLVSFTSQAP